MKRKLSLLFWISFLSSSVFSQQLDYELGVLDLNIDPNNPRVVESTYKAGEKIYLVTNNYWGHDLLVYDGDTIVPIVKDIEENILFRGKTSEGIFLTVGGFVPDNELYFVDFATSTFTLIHDFESNLKSFHSYQDYVIFLDHGKRLYASDGTVQGTQLLIEFDPSIFNQIEVQAQINNLLFLSNDDHVWVSDGTIAGTQSIPDIIPNAFNGEYVVSGNFVYFSSTTSNPSVIWRTDGTAQGTQAINTNGIFSRIEDMTARDGGVFFIGETAEFGKEIWTCSEIDTTLQLLVEIEPGQDSGVNDDVLNNFFPHEINKSHLLFRGGGSHRDEIWVSDGTTMGTQMIIDFSGLQGYDDFDVNYLIPSEDDKIFFIVENDTDLQSLYCHNFSNSQTDLLVEGIDALLSDAISAGDKFYFRSHTDDMLRVSDGTSAGTDTLGVYEGLMDFMGTHDGKLYFFASYSSDDFGIEPYVSDGTYTGTGLLKDLFPDNGNPLQGDSNPGFFFEFNGECHFIANNNIEGQVIYTTDGTESGTTTVIDLYPNTYGSIPEYLTKAGDKIYFSIQDTLWVSDGTSNGSKSLGKRFDHNSYYWGKTNERLFFVTNDSLFSTDGTVAGTYYLLPDQDSFNNNGNSDFNKFQPVLNGDELWFFYRNDIHGIELYKSDGTPSGTDTLFESLAGTETIFNLGSTSQIVMLNGRLYFSNYSINNGGRELWSTDGTLAGTSLVHDFFAGSSSFSPKRFHFFKNKIYFDAYDSSTQSTWVSDGTIAGTIKLADVSFNANNIDVVNIGNELFFVSDNNIWKTNGTPDGTELVIEQTNPPNSLTSFGDKIIYQLEDNNGDIEPWITDGTTLGTTLLKDINVNGNSNPQFFTVIQNLVFFNGKTSMTVSGGVSSIQEMWQSQGNETSTYPIPLSAYPISPITYGVPMTAPEDILKLRNRVYFIGNNTVFGKEIYYLEFSLPHVTVSGNVYHDENGNGLKDVDEIGINNFKILTENGGEYATYTDMEGDFEFTLPEGEFTISPVLNQCWNISSDSVNYLLNVSDTLMSGFDFGLMNTPDSNSIFLRLNSAATRCGFTVPFWLSLANRGCDSTSSVIQIELDSLVSFVNADIMPDSIDGQLLTWNIEGLEILEEGRIRMELLMPDEQSLGDTIFLFGKSYFLENDSLILSQEITFQSVINCAYDPNDKRVEPDRSNLSVDNYTLFDEKMTYTIRFQNTGTDTAFTVRIIDTLSNFLDIETFQPLASSHPMKTNIYPGRVIEFLFENILLPDSIVNEPKSHGFVSFEIYPTGDLQENDEIGNTAFIYFDFNSAIVTNTVNSTMVSTFDADEDGYDFWEDCDDNNSFVNLGVMEIPYNGVNDDCNDLTPDDDLDGDGYLGAQDCDDTNAEINPDGIEIQNNGIDEDCDGVDLIVSTEDLIEKNIEIFPNPTTDWLHFNMISSNLAQIQIKNISGQIIFNKIIADGSKIDLNNFESGVYVLIININERIFVKRIIKL